MSRGFLDASWSCHGELHFGDDEIKDYTGLLCKFSNDAHYYDERDSIVKIVNRVEEVLGGF